MGVRTEAFEQGFNSKKYQNPYDPSTEEYDDFERGWTQRLKRGLHIQETTFDWEQTDYLTYAMNKHKPSSVTVTKRPTFDELIKQYGLPKRR